MENTYNKTWFMPIRYDRDIDMTVICFTHGGGNAAGFLRWKPLETKANILALKLPGRESRIAEQPIVSAVELVDSIINAQLSSMDHPFIFYGHSMGAGLAFQTVVELQKRGHQLPLLLIASGREPPHCAYMNPTEHLNDDELISYLQALGGVSGQIPKDKDFLRQYIPKLRADYALNSSIMVRKPVPLPVWISVINGQDDSIIHASLLRQWALHTKYPLDYRVFPGGHFFMDEHFDEFIKAIAAQINQCLLMSV